MSDFNTMLHHATDKFSSESSIASLPVPILDIVAPSTSPPTPPSC